MPERWVVVASPITPSRSSLGTPKTRAHSSPKVGPPIIPNYDDIVPTERHKPHHSKLSNKTRSSILSDTSFISGSFIENDDETSSTSSSSSSLAATSVSSEYAYDTLDKEIVKNNLNKPSLGKSAAFGFALRGYENGKSNNGNGSKGGIKEGSIMERIEHKHRRKVELDYMKEEETKRRKAQLEKEANEPTNFFKDDYKMPIGNLPKTTKQEHKAKSIMEQLADFVTRPGALEGNTDAFELKPSLPKVPRTADIGSKSVGGRIILNQGGQGTYDLMKKSNNFYNRAHEIAVYPRERKDGSVYDIKGKKISGPGTNNENDLNNSINNVSMKNDLREDQLVKVKSSVAEFIMRGYESEENKLIAIENAEKAELAFNHQEGNSNDYLKYKRLEAKKSLGNDIKPKYKSTTKLHFDEKEKTLAKSFIYNSKGRPRRIESMNDDSSSLGSKVYSRWGDTRHGSTADICDSLSKLRYKAERIQNDIHDLNSENSKILKKNQKKKKNKNNYDRLTPRSESSSLGVSSVREDGDEDDDDYDREEKKKKKKNTEEEEESGSGNMKNDNKEKVNEENEEKKSRRGIRDSLPWENYNKFLNQSNSNKEEEEVDKDATSSSKPINQQKEKQTIHQYKQGSVWDPNMSICGRRGCIGCSKHHMKFNNQNKISNQTPGPSEYSITYSDGIKGGKISCGYPKSELDWIEYHEKQKPGPSDHPYLAPKHITGASFSASNSITELERIMRESSKKPGPTDHPNTYNSFVATKHASPGAKFAF